MSGRTPRRLRRILESRCGCLAGAWLVRSWDVVPTYHPRVILSDTSAVDLPLFLVALLIGGLAAWLAGRSRVARLEERLDAERRAAGEKGGAASARRDQSARRLRLALRRGAPAEQPELSRARPDQAREFQQRASSDLERRQQAVGDLVRPIQESLERVDEKIQEVERRASSRTRRWASRCGDGADPAALHTETANLVKALRAPKVRGRWGEIQLRRVVEMAGMIEHCDFEEQTASTRKTAGSGPT